jgi:hypothetical protein
MAPGPGFTRLWVIVGAAALAGGALALLAEPPRPIAGAIWIVLGLVNLGGAWRHRIVSRGGDRPR